MARLNHGTATPPRSRAQQANASDNTDPRQGALDAVEAAFPRLLLQATRLVARFSASAEYTAEGLLQEVTVEVLDGRNGSVDPVAYCFTRMLQLVANAIRKRARHDRKSDRARDAVHPSVEAPAERQDPQVVIDASRAVVDALTSVACDDEDVFALLDGFSKVAERDDVNDIRAKRRLVLEASGLDASRYGLAIKRLATMVRNLPDEVRRTALAAIGEDS